MTNLELFLTIGVGIIGFISIFIALSLDTTFILIMIK